MLEKQQGIVDRALSMLRIKKEVGDAHISSQLHLRLVVTVRCTPDFLTSANIYLSRCG